MNMGFFVPIIAISLVLIPALRAMYKEYRASK
jgi:hypothetical protein